MTDDDYYILLIIISVIGFALLIGFAIYYLYLPSFRANSYFNDIYEDGGNALDKAKDLGKQVIITNNQIQVFLIGFCDWDKEASTEDKKMFFGTTFKDFCENLDITIPKNCS